MELNDGIGPGGSVAFWPGGLDHPLDYFWPKALPSLTKFGPYKRPRVHSERQELLPLSRDANRFARGLGPMPLFADGQDQRASR